MSDTDIGRIYSAYQCDLEQLEPVNEEAGRFNFIKGKKLSNFFWLCLLLVNKISNYINLGFISIIIENVKF